MPSHSLPETVFAEVLAKHALMPHEIASASCKCGWKPMVDSYPPAAHAEHRAHVAERLAECLVFVGVEHEKGGKLYRVGRCPDDSPVYRIRESETT